MIFVRLIDERLGLVVRVEIVADEVVISVIHDTVNQGAELACIAKGVRLDGLEDLFESGIDDVAAVIMVVAEVLDGLGEVAEEEDVRVADFAGDLDLGMNVSLARRYEDIA